MAEVVDGVLWRKRREGFGECLLQGNNGTGFESAKLLFHLCPAFFNGVEVRGIGRQIAERSAGVLDKFSDAVHPVSAQVVHNDQLTGFQVRTQNVLQIGEKNITVGGGFYGHDSYPAGKADGSQYCQGAPSAGGNSFIDAGTVQCSAITPRHLRGDTAFVDKDELRGVDTPRFGLPELALSLDSFAVLLGGAERLFLRRRPICFRTIQSHVIPTSTSWLFRRSS